MGKIKKLLESELIGGSQNNEIYPVTSTKAVYNSKNITLDDIVSELDLHRFSLMSIQPDENLINIDKAIKGYYVTASGSLLTNPNYGILYVPMNGKNVSTNLYGNVYLAACDSYGKITHVNSNSVDTDKSINYVKGDEYAILSILLNNKTATAKYGNDIPKYTEPGYFPKHDGIVLASTVNSMNRITEEAESIIDLEYLYNSTLEVGNINDLIMSNLNISKGYKFTVNASGTAKWSRLLCQFYDDSGAEQRVDNIQNGVEVSAVANINITKLRLYCATTTKGDLTLKINRPGELSALKKEVNNPTKQVNGSLLVRHSISQDKLDTSIVEISKNLFNPNDTDVKVGYFLTVNGELSENANYIVSGFIPFTKDMINLQASIDGIAIDGGGFSLLYDANKTKIIAFSNKDSRGLLKWQEGVAFARFSFDTGDINKNLQVEQNDKITSYKPYGVKILKSLLPDISILSSPLGNAAGTISKGTLNDSEILTLENFPWHIKKRLIMSFSASITSFSSILIGKGLNQYRGDYLKIDSTNITQLHYEQSESEKETVAHGLSIDTFIKVSLLSDNSGYLYVILQSKAGTFKHVFKQWAYEANWAPFVKSIGSTLTDLKFNAGCQDFRLPVWAFGDSYFGVAANRWIGAIRDMKFFNFLVNGLAGQDSIGAYNDLQRCLNFGTPKYLLWCLGMNDGNNSFISIFNKVITLCESKGITLIASTIPTVPNRDKEVISKYVRDSGVRYIDFYKAMGANAGGTWYDGYLDSDRVHPTSLGAQAQAMQVLIDFPELMQYGLTSTEGVIGDSTGDH